MKLIDSKKRYLPKVQPKWAISIKENYGSKEQFLKRWNPGQQEYCMANITKSADVPPLVRISITYGNKLAESFLIAQITEAVISMGELDMEPSEIKLAAQFIRMDERLRTLNLAFILTFFAKLKCGQYKIYGKLTSRKLLETMQSYYETAIDEQRRAIYNAEKQKEKERRQQHEKVAIPFSQYRKENGIEEETLEEYIVNAIKKPR